MFRIVKRLIDKNGVSTTRMVNPPSEAATERLASVKAEPPRAATLVEAPSAPVPVEPAAVKLAPASRGASDWHVRSDDGVVEKCSSPYNCPFGGYDSGHTKTMKAATTLRDEYQAGITDPNASAYFFFMSDDESETFSQGDCAALAKELHRTEGYPIATIGIKTEATSEVEWVHVAVQSPDGRFLDVTGVQPEASLVSAWSGHMGVRDGQSIVVEMTDEKNVDAYFGFPDGIPQEAEQSFVTETAVKVASALTMDFAKR
jgi:hypothetical protein